MKAANDHITIIYIDRGLDVRRIARGCGLAHCVIVDCTMQHLGPTNVTLRVTFKGLESNDAVINFIKGGTYSF